MSSLIYVTGNDSKFMHAQEALMPFGITLIQEKVDTEEIQSDSIESVAHDKAKKAFTVLQKSLFVNDAGWIIPSLNGFPGPYMKFVNEWFSPQDFLNLMRDKTDRRIILRQVIVFTDGKMTKEFIHDETGEIVKEARGKASLLWIKW